MKTEAEVNYIKGINTNKLNNISSLREQIKSKKEEITDLEKREHKLTNSIFEEFQKL